LWGCKQNRYISGGYNVYPPEVEEVLTDHEAVEQAMVIDAEDDDGVRLDTHSSFGRPGAASR